MSHLVIIGNGITGTTVARQVRKRSDMKISMISSESRYFFSRTALMYIYMGHMKFEHTKPYEDWFWEENDIDLIYDHVNAIDTDTKHLSLKEGDFGPLPERDPGYPIRKGLSYGLVAYQSCSQDGLANGPAAGQHFRQ